MCENKLPPVHLISIAEGLQAPHFFTLFETWNTDAKTAPSNWEYVKVLEDYLAAATNISLKKGCRPQQDRCHHIWQDCLVAEYVYGDSWYDFERVDKLSFQQRPRYIQKSWDTIQKIWSNRNLAYQHSFTVHFVHTIEELLGYNVRKNEPVVTKDAKTAL